MKVLAVDVGGTNVKILATGQTERRRFPSGRKLTAEQMVAGVKKLAADWQYDVVSVGYPGPVLHGRPINDPPNLGKGWVGFDFQKAFGCPVKVINDAAMQALGSYKGGRMLFLGLGTGLGSAMVIDGDIEPMELGHLPYRKAHLRRLRGTSGNSSAMGERSGGATSKDVVERFVKALEPTEVVLGGGNTKLLKALPPRCSAGANANAFVGGFRLWGESAGEKPASPVKASGTVRRVNGPEVKSKAQAAGA